MSSSTEITLPERFRIADRAGAASAEFYRKKLKATWEVIRKEIMPRINEAVRAGETSIKIHQDYFANEGFHEFLTLLGFSISPGLEYHIYWTNQFMVEKRKLMSMIIRNYNY